MYFDTHAHYDDKAFDGDRDAVLSALAERGVSLVLDPGCDGESSRAAAALAERWSAVVFSAGWQPEEWASWDAESLPLLRELCAREKCAAVGEIGLDYHWDREHLSLQHAMFRAQLALARELGRPVIVHDREAHADCLAITAEFPEVRGVFHCFSGSAEMAEVLLRRGWYLGFDGPVTYPNNRKAAAVLAVCPPERILLETDSPYLPPEPLRGTRNDSRNLPLIAARVAEAKGIPLPELAALTAENGRTLFGLK